MMRLLPCLLLLPLLAFAQEMWLSPADFGLQPMSHGRWDYARTPAGVLAGHFNGDHYPDLARANGSRLEVYYARPQGFPSRPDGVQIFRQSIRELRLEGSLWSRLRPLSVTLEDGRQETISCRPDGLELAGDGFPLPQTTPSPPRQTAEADFQLVWESPAFPFGLDACTVGDLDGDEMVELATWWKPSHYADTAWIAIYKCSGDNQYELFLEDTFSVEIANYPGISQMLITDVDQNGQKELAFTYDKTYFWEFTAPGVFTRWRSDIQFPFYVTTFVATDADRDSIPELAALCSMTDQTPPCYYMVKEFAGKDTTNHVLHFNNITYFSQDWSDVHMAVGDFDNDGATDLVSGNVYVWGYDPTEVQYFRYDPTCANPPNFRRCWLQTGIPLSCVSPEIADFDADGANELFAAGCSPNGSSAFVWEAPGFQSGSVTWLDTISAPDGPIYETIFGWVDGLASVAGVYIMPIYPTATTLSLWRHQDGGYVHAWESPEMDTCFYYSPRIFDADYDQKMSIITVNGIQKQAADWEQISASVEADQNWTMLGKFILHPCFPNPFNSSTEAYFELPAASHISLRIYDTAGRVVATLVNGWRDAGRHATTFDGSSLASGMYLYHLRAGNHTATGKMMLLK